jgi:hypothetical protein
MWSDLINVLSSPSFMETTALLVVTALLTGFLVPRVKGRMDTKNLKKQQAFQAEIARRSKLVDAQAELLEVLADVLGGLRMLYTKIAFYARDSRDEEFQLAFEDFEKRSWDFFAGYRTQLSKAGRLTSQGTRDELRHLYYCVLMPTDRRLYILVNRRIAAKGQGHGSDDSEAWRDFFDYLFRDFTDAIDRALNQVTEEIRRAES